MHRIVKRVGVVVNPAKQDGVAEAGRFVPWVLRRGKEVGVDRDATDLAAGTDARIMSRDDMRDWADLVVVFGGDGTLLSAARSLGGGRPCLLGVNVGHLGFLTQASLENVYSVAESVLDGDFQVQERMMLRCVIHRASGGAEPEQLALNDVVISKEALARILQLEVSVRNELLALYRSDGMIVATPTGSTGHSLSAGGPIVCPDLETIILCPICPHTLSSNRPIVLSPDLDVRIRVASAQEVVGLTVDGQVGMTLATGDVVEVTRATARARLISLSPERYFRILRTKLGWGE